MQNKFWVLWREGQLRRIFSFSLCVFFSYFDFWDSMGLLMHHGFMIPFSRKIMKDFVMFIVCIFLLFFFVEFHGVVDAYGFHLIARLCYPRMVKMKILELIGLFSSLVLLDIKTINIKWFSAWLSILRST